MLKELLGLLNKENPLRVSYEEAGEMLTKSKDLFDQATTFVLEGKQPDFDLHKADKELNKLHQDIRRRLLEHLTINPKQDLVAALMLLSVVDDIERLGDYCKNIEELPAMADLDEDKARLCVNEKMKEASRRIGEALTVGCEAFVDADVDKARHVMAGHRPIRILCDEVTQAQFDDDAAERRCAILIVLYMRFLKRISAHLKNICSGVANPFDMIGYTKTGLESSDGT